MRIFPILKRVLTLVAVALGCIPAIGQSQTTFGTVRNGSFDSLRQVRANDPMVANAVKARWRLPKDLILPSDWGPNPNTPDGVLEYATSGGWQGSPYIKLDGGGHLTSYFGLIEPRKSYIGSLRVRGRGKVSLGAYVYDTDGQIGGVAVVEREISTNKWIEYRGVYANGKPMAAALNLFVSGQGHVEIDEVHFQTADWADVEIAREMSCMYGTGALIEDPDVQAFRADEAHKSRLSEFHAAIQTVRANRAKVDKAMLESIERKAAAIEQYVSGGDKLSVLAAGHNDMIAFTRVLQRQAGATVRPPLPAPIAPVASAAGYKPGERIANRNTVTVTEVKSNKVRYDENETATTVVTLVNTTAAPIQGSVVAIAIADLDDSRQIASVPISLNIGVNKWSFRYNVGPQTYGRAIEVRFLDASGKIIDTWQEYYAVAAEWFRVQQHVDQAMLKNYRTDPWVSYFNQKHYFASEPTDFGVRMEDVDEYIAPQVGYHVNQPARKGQIEFYKSIGIVTTIYQTLNSSGNMGYEVIRRHPEFALYDSNGQFAVDPWYGGYPNPMEIASPIEIGPKRKVAKPYLDRKITPWGHVPVNTALRETVEFEAHAVKEYAHHLGFGGVYIDGNLGVMTGYGYDGKPNVATNSFVDYMKINARNHQIFSRILKSDNPNFGTWYNWAYSYCDYFLAMGQKWYVGSGGKGDVGDENIRAAAAANSMFLMEMQHNFSKTDAPATSPTYHLNMLIENRDLMMQKYGANMVMGYLFPWREPENPGANRWGWATLNYFGAQLVATQHHLAGGFVPSMRPWLQFMTRYSRYIWAPDAKVVPHAEEILRVSAPADVEWKQLTYKLKTADGYDLIVHLVRMPPTKKWDIDWMDEPTTLDSVAITANLGSDALRDVWAVRPYDFEEEQQTHQSQISATAKVGSVSIRVPPFRYHTMIVFRVKATAKSKIPQS